MTRIRSPHTWADIVIIGNLDAAIGVHVPRNQQVSSADRHISDDLARTQHNVGDVLGYLAGGMTEAELLADFPQLVHDDVRACLGYAAERERRTGRIPAA